MNRTADYAIVRAKRVLVDRRRDVLLAEYNPLTEAFAVCGPELLPGIWVCTVFVHERYHGFVGKATD